MFDNNSKKLDQLPNPPTLSEISEDLKTFRISKTNVEPKRIIDPNADIDEWWAMFETYIKDTDDLNEIQKKVNEYLVKLEETKLNLETSAKNIENKIEEILEKTRREFDDD